MVTGKKLFDSVRGSMAFEDQGALLKIFRKNIKAACRKGAANCLMRPRLDKTGGLWYDCAVIIKDGITEKNYCNHQKETNGQIICF